MATVPKILIVDDEPLLCKSLSELMKLQGYNSFSAYSGKDAELMLSEHEFDLALIDMNLPDTDGHYLMDHIRSISPETLSIIITGEVSMDSVIGALKRGAYDYVRKPIEPEYLTKVIRNALEQKKLKSENKIVNDKLHLSEERYRSLVQNSPDIIYTLDVNGRFTFINSAAKILLGYENGSLIGKHFSEIIHDDDLEKAEGLFNDRRTGDRATSSAELKLKMAPSLAKISKFNALTVELKCSGLYSEIKEISGKRYIGTYGVVRDISQRKHLEVKLRNFQKMKAVGVLAGGVAHDFNNLLMGIQGYTSIMLMDMSSENIFYDKLKSIEQYVQKGAELTRQLLGFAKGRKFTVKPINMNDLIKDVTRMFGRTKKEIIIYENFENNILSVDADAGQLEQVMLNLLLNAANAMPEGGEVRLETKNVILAKSIVSSYGINNGEYVMVSVSDIGVGMDEAVQQRIFEPFFTTNEMGHGTGLGLASAYGIINNHNGFIDVESIKGAGTTFRLYLPASSGIVKCEESAWTKAVAGPETVLLIDDEDMIIEVGGEILKALGYRVILARSGEEAVDLYRKNADQIDIVVLDMIMPGMGGSETFDRLMEVNPAVKVLLSSGYGLDGMAADIMEKGCTKFIQKPFDVNELSQSLRDVLD